MDFECFLTVISKWIPEVNSQESLKDLKKIHRLPEDFIDILQNNTDVQKNSKKIYGIISTRTLPFEFPEKSQFFFLRNVEKKNLKNHVRISGKIRVFISGRLVETIIHDFSKNIRRISWRMLGGFPNNFRGFFGWISEKFPENFRRDFHKKSPRDIWKFLNKIFESIPKGFLEDFHWDLLTNPR